MACLYRPANGTEGDYFIAQWCDRCVRGTQDDPCEILGNSFFFHVTDPEYPREWIEDDSGPRCTAFAASQDDADGIIADPRQQGLL